MAADSPVHARHRAAPTLEHRQLAVLAESLQRKLRRAEAERDAAIARAEEAEAQRDAAEDESDRFRCALDRVQSTAAAFHAELLAGRELLAAPAARKGGGTHGG